MAAADEAATKEAEAMSADQDEAAGPRRVSPAAVDDAVEELTQAVDALNVSTASASASAGLSAHDARTLIVVDSSAVVNMVQEELLMAQQSGSGPDAYRRASLFTFENLIRSKVRTVVEEGFTVIAGIGVKKTHLSAGICDVC